MAETLISSEVDFDAEGKQSGYLRVPHSTQTSAYGWIPIPITVLRNGDGPTLLMTAGVHGDEYEGQLALAKLSNELAHGDIRGQLILMPATNPPAALAGRRTSPIDEGNLNRAFPGDPAGTPTEMIAHYIEHHLLPRCDYLVDLHSGGTSLWYPPTVLRGRGSNDDEMQKLVSLQTAFDLPYAWVFTSGGGRNSTARTAMGAANRNGVISVMAELGGGGAVDREILAATERGLLRILHALGMLPEYEPDAPSGTRELHSQGSVFAYEVGVFEPLKDIGDAVEADETIGFIRDPLACAADPIPVRSTYSGLVLAKRHLGRVERGDAVFQIARDADRS